MMMPSNFFDDVSSIESSSRRERKYSEERLAEQATMINTLSNAVQRLSGQLQTKEAELQMKDRAEVDLESKVLDLMIENAELKSQMMDRDNSASVQDRSSSWQKKNQRTPATTDDFSSFQREAMAQVCLEDLEGFRHEVDGNRPVHRSAVTQVDRPLLERRSTGPASSKVTTRKLPKTKSGLGGRSLFANLEANSAPRLSWSKGSRGFLKMIPRHVSIFNGMFTDDISDLSSM